jgi:hypothetical protein
VKSIPRRTIFLALVATCTFVWAAIYKFDVPAQEMAWLLAYCVLGCLATALFAALCFAVVVGVRKLWSWARGQT